MTDLSGETVIIVLNPAGNGTSYDDTTGLLTFTDAAGNTQHIAVPKPAKLGGLISKIMALLTNGWWTCFPQKCIP